MKLKGCPFCGGNGKMENENTSWYVECEQCHVESNYYDSKEEAADAWNFRVGDEDLKPCPFCGSKRVQLYQDYDDDDYCVTYYVECYDCGGRGPSGSDTEEKNAAAAWNRRADG